MRNGYHDFLEDEVLSASPLELVQLLYAGALDAIGAARRHLRRGEIRSRCGAINKAMAIVTELSLSLDREAGGELTKNLSGLYAYVQRLLIEANTQQIDAPLATAERLLDTLLEGWRAIPVTRAAATGDHDDVLIPGPLYERVSCAF